MPRHVTVTVLNCGRGRMQIRHPAQIVNQYAFSLMVPLHLLEYELGSPT